MTDLTQIQGCNSNRKGCTNPPDEPHTCPYAEDINGDYETLCTCCPDCAAECAANI